jgi:hypothetical protein
MLLSGGSMPKSLGAASRKYADVPLQRTGRHKGNKQALSCGGAVPVSFAFWPSPQLICDLCCWYVEPPAPFLLALSLEILGPALT